MNRLAIVMFVLSLSLGCDEGDDGDGTGQADEARPAECGDGMMNFLSSPLT